VTHVPSRFGVATALCALPLLVTSGIAGCGGGDSPPGIGTSSVDAGHDGAHEDGAAVGDGTSPTSDAGADGASSDGPATDATGDGTVVDSPPEDTGTVLPIMPLCDPTTVWGAPTTVLTTEPADSTTFSGVTPDELTVAWTSTVGGDTTAWIADRASTGAAFGAAQSLASTFGALQSGRVSLSGDGLRIVGVRSDAKGFVAAIRSAQPNAFDTADTNEFSEFMSGESAVPPAYATPLLSGDDEEFFYLLTSATTDDVAYESTTGLPRWFPGSALGVAQLQRSGTSYRRPSGISLDDLTLFYWDEASESEKMAWRSFSTSPFSTFVDIGALANASPTADCTRIYYSTPGAAGAVTIEYADNADQ
jgi:hypothetical protein